MSPSYAFGDGPDGRPLIHIRDTALPCAGVALRLRAVIDCTPSQARMPPVTIDFLTKNLMPALKQPWSAAAARFTCDAGEFILTIQMRRVEAMVAAAGLPPACAPSVDGFLRLSLSSAANSFYKAVAVTVEAGDPGSILAAGGDDEPPPESEDEAVPPAGDCAICYEGYLDGGGAAAVRRLACGHAFHRGCIDSWTAMNRSCPCCRAPVPRGGELEVPTWDVVSGSYLSMWAVANPVVILPNPCYY
ncbi:unnamed protein product [Urochloa humidicola]